MAENIVTLNVGGTLYTTTYSTLTRYPDSMLATLFGGTEVMPRDKDGNTFIDRDGNIFRYVLNFLRCGQFTLPETSSECRLLEVEAGFYQIKPLIDQLENRHIEYIDVVYPTNYYGNEIHGVEHIIEKLKANLEIKEKGILEKNTKRHRTILPLKPMIDPRVLSTRLRELGWERQDSCKEFVPYSERRMDGSLMHIVYIERWCQSGLLNTL